MFLNVLIIIVYMKEKTILKVALACSLLGIVGLLFVSERISLDSESIDRIDATDVDKIVYVSGKVVSVNSGENVVFINIEYDEVVPVIVFSSLAENLSVGEHISVVGKVDEYEGSYEILAEEIAYS